MDSILAVVTAPTTTALTTAAVVRAHLGLTPDKDAALTTLIAQASAAIDSYTGRSLARATVTETFRRRDIGCPEHLALTRTPVTTISAITEDDTALTSDQWEMDPESGLLYRLEDDCRWAWTAAKTVVSYTGGYLLPATGVTSTLPADIERACILTAAAWHHAAGRDLMLRSETIEGIGSSSWLDPAAEALGLPQQAAALLVTHQRTRVG